MAGGKAQLIDFNSLTEILSFVTAVELIIPLFQIINFNSLTEILSFVTE